VDDYAVDQVGKYEKELYSFFDSNYSNLLDEIKTKKVISEELESSVKSALEELKNQLGDLS
jgi:F-type H+-transporting ATPase subunit alpha